MTYKVHKSESVHAVMVMLAMIDNRQELEQFLPEFYARGVDELL